MGRGTDPTLAAAPRQDARRPTRPLELLIRDPRLAAQRQVMIDFDSTIFPLIDAMADHPLGSEITYEVIQRYEDLPKACGGIERMLLIFDEVMGYRAMRSYAPFPGAPDAINRLAQRDFAVHVVSNRDPGLEDDVGRWLADHGIEVSSVVCAERLDKVSWCRENGVEIMVDDHPGTLSAAHAAGLEVRSLAFNYNRRELQAAGLPLSRDWRELAEHLDDSAETALARSAVLLGDACPLEHNGAGCRACDLG